LTQPDEARDEILARLAQSRAEIRRLLEPPPDDTAGESPSARGAGAFPRSRTMRTLMGGGGLGAAGAILAGLFIVRPTLAWRLIRMLPTGALARTFILRGIAAVRSRR
jgi:alkanesulfonate monooxygenase SsuD/methylene tetrahydromethanopterin reductase-like flavin-dependent oxidoreductase (luciferase family)